MTDRIREFLKNRKEEGPCLVLDLDIVRDNYSAFARTLPDTKVYYAVKANPHPEILSLLARLGSSFDVASVPETLAVLATGCTPERISYGNTIKKESEIAAAFKLGVTLFAVDCDAEVDKIAASTATAPVPNGRCRANSAVSRNSPPTSSNVPISRAWSRTAFRSMSARSSTMWKPGTAR